MNANEPVSPEYTKNYTAPATYSPSGGLTKREYFAAMAMQGLLSNSQAMDALPKHVAECARINADALIAELNKEK